MGVISENLKPQNGHIQSVTHGDKSFKLFIQTQTNLKLRRSGTDTGATLIAHSSLRELFADHSEAWVATCSIANIHS